MLNINVIKRDGSKEPYQEDKIAKVAKAAGLNEEQSKQVAQKVTQALSNPGKGEVTSIKIRDIVSSELHKVDEYAANLFDWYQMIKEDGTP